MEDWEQEEEVGIKRDRKTTWEKTHKEAGEGKEKENENRNRNRKLQISKSPLKSQAQGTSIFTSAA